MHRTPWSGRFFWVLVTAFALSSLLHSHAAKAADVTVCNTACDYTTITDAIIGGGFSPGDSIFVGADYASTTESFPFNVSFGVNLDCQNSGAVIGVDDENNPVNVHPQSSNIFRNCQYSNVSIQSNNESDIQILDNTFFGNSRISTNNVTNITATGNLGLMGMSFGNTVGAIIDSNTINSLSYVHGDALQISNSTSVQFTRNIITDFVTSTPTGDQIIGITGNSFDIYFASNTVSMPFSTFSGGGLSMLEIATSLGITVRDNLFSMSGNGGGIQAFNFNGSGGDIAVDAEHNTIKLNNPCNGCSGILMSSWNVSNVAVTSSYNLIVATTPSSTASMTGHSSYGAGPSSSLQLYVDHEGFAGLNAVSASPADFPVSPNAIILQNQPFKLLDVPTNNDSELVPYSAFLDVNGTEDIGAVPGVRGNNFHIDELGSVDYSSVDSTSTDPVMESLRNSDTVHIAAGTYGAIYLAQQPTSPVALTGNVSILGTPNTYIIATSTHALDIQGVSNSIFQDMIFSGASTTVATTYSTTLDLFNYNSIDYDQTGFLFAPNLMLVVADTSCSASFVSADGQDITAAVGSATSNFNVGLVDLFGNKITILVPNNVASSGAALHTLIAGPCVTPNTVDQFIPNVLTANGNGTFTYNAAAVAAASASLKTGLTNPPAITQHMPLGPAGIVLNNSNDNTFTHVTSTANSAGVLFEGSSNGNSIFDSSLFANTRDVTASSTGSNALFNTGFSPASSNIVDSGFVDAYFTVRTHVLRASNSSPVAGQDMSIISANHASSTTQLTDSLGFTPFTSFHAMRLSSSDHSASAGGFNPYQIIASPEQFALNSTSSNLLLPYQTFEFALTGSPGSSGGGSGAGGLPSTSGGGGGIPATLPSSPTRQDNGSVAALSILASLGLAPGDLVKLPSDGNIITQEDSTVYEIGTDGRRHAFPNPSVYFSRHCDFKSVKIIVSDVMRQLALGPNMTYLPGLRLVKFLSLPTVYLVQSPNVLRAIPDEATARVLAGATWNKQVSDISDAFYLDYIIGSPIVSTTDLNLSPPSCKP